ncbi:hypothetical protein ACHAPT_006248 [Fusarium lateritium]
MNNTQTPQAVPDLPVYEFLDWPIFWFFLSFISFNFAAQEFGAFLGIKSRTSQCILVILSSFFLPVQLIEGYWILETVARYASQVITPAADATGPVTSVILHYIGWLVKVSGCLVIFLIFIAIGTELLWSQFHYMTELLKLKIQDDDGEGSQRATKTKDKRQIQVHDLEAAIGA